MSAAAELDGEWRRGDWLLCEADAASVFTDDVETLWEELAMGMEGVRLCSRVTQGDESWSERME